MDRPLVVCVLLGTMFGCHGYQPGSFRGGRAGASFQGERRTVGCLDVAVAEVDDPRTQGMAVGFTVANRCDAAAVVDFSAVVVTAYLANGGVAPMRAFDPNSEIRPASLEARSVAREIIEYQPEPSELAVQAYCVDIRRLDGDAPAPAAMEVCYPVARRVAGTEVW